MGNAPSSLITVTALPPSSRLPASAVSADTSLVWLLPPPEDNTAASAAVAEAVVGTAVASLAPPPR